MIKERLLLPATITSLVAALLTSVILASASEPPAHQAGAQTTMSGSERDLGSIGTFVKWSKVEATLAGPDSQGMNNDPNPFKINANVTFQGPGGTFVVPAFYDGDGAGGLDGNVWRVRFSPNAAGTWTFSSTSTEPLLNGHIGSFEVTEAANCPSHNPGGMPDFSCLGRLEWVGDHYLRFADGPYWLKAGVDDPEDFLAAGETVGFGTKEEAIDYLAGMGVNSLYFMTHNVGGDARNVWPWVGANESEAQANHEHFDVAKLADWEDLFAYMQSKGLVLHLVLEDDSGWTGFNRQMYYRQLIARFGHHSGLIWNVSEEYNENYAPDQVKNFAQMIRDLDPYDHPITVHHAGSLAQWDPFVGHDQFDLTSFQTGDSPQNSAAASWFQQVEDSGRVIAISFDETGRIDASDQEKARHIVWSVYTGGANYEMHIFPLDSYEDYAAHFEDMTRARTFIEQLPFWLMRPMNNLLVSGSGYVFAQPGEVYVMYLPSGGRIDLDLSSTTNTYEAQWFNPRDGTVVAVGTVEGGEILSLTAPDTNDWALLLVHTCCFGDLDCDGDVDVADIMLVADRWSCRCGDECYDTWYDLDGDCDIDIVDIMTVASCWGCQCGDECYGTAVSAISQVEPRLPMGPASVRLETDNSMVAPGETFTVTVEIERAVDLGAFQLALNFAPTVVHVEEVALGNFLGSTGRNTAPLGPEIDNDAGIMRFGAFSFGDLQGPDGDGALAILTMTAQGTGSSPLALANVQVADTGGQTQMATVEDGAVVVGVPQRIYLPLVGEQ